MTAYDSDNIFAKIIRGEIPCNRVYEDEYVLAFHDMFPAAPVHVLVIPKGEYLSFDDFMAKADSALVTRFFAKVQEIAGDLGVQESGYRVISNHGADASQTVPHFHMHILGGRALGGLVPSDELAR